MRLLTEDRHRYFFPRKESELAGYLRQFLAKKLMFGAQYLELNEYLANNALMAVILSLCFMDPVSVWI